jgi:hypothetical protein
VLSPLRGFRKKYSFIDLRAMFSVLVLFPGLQLIE